MTSIGVAISTTGDEHRLELLAQCIAKWRASLSAGPPVNKIIVTIDGSEADVQRVLAAVGYEPVTFLRVGRPPYPGDIPNDHRLGVAVSKNTGLEALMNATDVEHLFLSDDDTWPLSHWAWREHIEMDYPHSMVMWGKHRWTSANADYATWNWPRGVVLHQTRAVVERVGGMIEEFGAGGHEHVEYSRRIHQAGFTPAPFISPPTYAYGAQKMGARLYWHAEDMPREHEGLSTLRARKRALTTIRRPADDWPRIEALMASRDGDTSFVPYTAAENGRASATLYRAD